MSRSILLSLFAIVASLPLTPMDASAAIEGRFIRVEAPAGSRMGIHEVEVWSGGKNVALKNAELKFAGVSYAGRDINERKEGARLIDGVADLPARSLEFMTRSEVEVNPWVEMDFGRELPMQRPVVKSTLKPIYDDRAVRLVSVLDGQRRVIWTACYDIRRKPYDQGIADFELGAMSGPLIGRVVPAGAGQWAPLSDVLAVAPMTPPPDAAERARRFAQRNSPEAIRALADAFFSRMNLAKPELAGVRELLERGEAEAALDAYAAHFIRKIQGIVFVEADRPGQPVEYDAAAEDLLKGVAVIFSRYEVEAQRFTPGTIYWGEHTPDDQASIDVARTRVELGRLQRPLLLAYGQTGRPEFLDAWQAITDDWGMNVQADLDRAADGGVDLRNDFSKDEVFIVNRLAKELARVAGQRPELVDRLSGATLARMLIPVLEEVPPSYWWVVRRTSYNHTYNALITATVTSRVLDDFHAGQRLDNENRQHWFRVWTTMMTRDGSMNEVGDEGHMFMQWRMAAIFDQMKRTPPWWMTDDFVAEFETGWRMTANYPLRHVASDGRAYRLTRRTGDYFMKMWWLHNPGAAVGELPACPTADFSDIIRHPEYVSRMQAIYGAGREREKLSTERQGVRDLVTGAYGTSYTPPARFSDWMPYAGLWDLRRSWEPDAGYVHMIAQPKGHPSTNGSSWNTETHYIDCGQPAISLSPVWIDGQPPFNEAGTQTFKPGSKTETLAVASPLPIPSRWHSSPLLDYAESFYEGVYQSHHAEYAREFHRLPPVLGDSPIADARADRRVILFRPAPLLIVTDAVRTPDAEKQRSYEIRQRFATPPRASRDAEPPRGSFEGTPDRLVYRNQNMPTVHVSRFTRAALSWDKRNTPDPWDNGAAMSTHNGYLHELGGILRAETRGNLLMSALIEAHRPDDQTVVQGLTDLTTEGVTGFAATLKDGGVLTWLNTSGDARDLSAGPIQLRGEGLLLFEKDGQTSGLILGGEALRIGGEAVPLPSADLEFALRDGRFTVTAPIHRPIMPVTFLPQEPVFTDSQQVTLSSATPGVEIRYTLDGSEPELTSPLYAGPLTITADTYIRARAFRPGVREITLDTSGTQFTVVSDARFYRRDLKPAVSAAGPLETGLKWELVRGNWRALFSHLNLPAVMPAEASGKTTRLLDVSMRQGDGPFGVRYSGWIDIPADGVWTIHPPAEYVGATCEPGYDLRVWIDGEEWDIGQRFHGWGIWTVPLARGLHRLEVTFADARHRDRTVHNAGLWAGYPSPWVVWKGEAPVIEIAGPGVDRQPIPSAWLRTD